jgi:hypothetical protein
MLVSQYLLQIIYLDDDSKIFRGFQTEDEAKDWAMAHRTVLRLAQSDTWRVLPDRCAITA